MTGLMALWLPILVASVFVFIASSLVHMVLPWHKNDYPRLQNEDAVLDALRPLAIPQGDYMMPRPTSRDDMKSAAFKEKMERGPVVMMTVFPSRSMSMGKNLSQWFIYTIVVSIFAAYITGHAAGADAHYRRVFRFAGATAFACYGMALWQQSIWYGRSWALTLKMNIDALIYAGLTAGTFGWLWPR